MTYTPDPAILAALTDAATKLVNAEAVPHDFDPAPEFLGRLTSGEIFFDSELQLDTDGWPDGEGRGDPDWQLGHKLATLGWEFAQRQPGSLFRSTFELASTIWHRLWRLCCCSF